MPLTQHAPVEDPGEEELATTRLEVMSFRPTPSTQVREQLQPETGELKASDVSIEEREQRITKTKNKFADIFSVSNPDCHIFKKDILESFSDNVNVAGTLSRPSCVEFFRSIGAPNFVLDTLKSGHHSTLLGEVPTFEKRNHGSFFKHNVFAISEIKTLLSLGKVEIVSEKPHCVHPLHVVVQRNKTRLILDCGFLNEYVVVPKIKFDDYKMALNYFRSRGFITSFDFKDFYHALAINPRFRKFLGFSLVLDGKKVFCQWNVGCFGLSDLPWMLTKIFRCLVKHWRSSGIQICLYLDDGWSFNEDYEEGLRQSIHIRSDLFKAGIIWSVKKSNWTPCQEVEWLGLVWNSDFGTLKVAERRITKIKDSIARLLAPSTVSIRDIASFVGRIISLGPVVGNISRLMSRFCQMSIAESISYDDVTVLDSNMKTELNFWNSKIEQLNSRACFSKKPPVTVVIEGDASSSGCGSFIQGQDLKAARLFTESERETHSTWRELENIHFSLKSLGRFLSGRSVKFRVDNQSSVNIIENGSMKADCHQFALEVQNFCFLNQISLHMEWIPRDENKEADLLSRLPDILDTDDWGLTKEFFRILDNRWGPFSLDCFANFYNFKVHKFYSLFYVPGSSGTDSFTFDWNKEFCLLTPPVSVVGRTLEHLFTCKSKGVLVVPLWPSAFFWPLLQGFFSSFIQDVLRVKGSKVLELGRNKNSLLGSPDFHSDVLAIYIDCSFA